VFFDAVGLEWLYEPEGFDFGEGLRYLPDFYINGWDVWIEVKAGFPSDEELLKFIALCENSPSIEGYPNHRKKHSLICGTPGRPKVQLNASEPYMSPGDSYFILSYSGHRVDDRPFVFLDCFAYVDGGQRLDIWPIYFQADWLPIPHEVTPHSVDGNESDLRSLTLFHGPVSRRYVGKGIHYYTPKLARAYTAARSARFEHGENG